MDNVTAVMTGSAIVAGCGLGMIAFGMAKVAGKYDRDTEAMATNGGDLTPHQVIDNLRKVALRGRISPFPTDMLQRIREAERVVPEASATCEICQGTLFADHASFAINPCPRCRPMAVDGEAVALPRLPGKGTTMAGSAIRHAAQALAELTRYNQEGAANDRFPLDEDVEIFLAKALQATINILLAYQPSEHEREELAQLEAALYKFITDYGA